MNNPKKIKCPWCAAKFRSTEGRDAHMRAKMNASSFLYRNSRGFSSRTLHRPARVVTK